VVILKIILIFTLIIVLIQDIKERQVYWFLFPIIGICSGVLLYQNMFSELFFTTLIVNLLFVLILLLVVFLYSKLKLKANLSETFGLGDALLFFALIFTFSSITFIVLFVFGLLFSLVLHLFLSRKSKQKTVPLAGYLGLFFAIVYISHWVGLLKSVYNI
jgi:hypothetical protein